MDLIVFNLAKVAVCPFCYFLAFVSGFYLVFCNSLYGANILSLSFPCFLSLPRPLYVTVVYQGKYSHCMRIGVAVPLNSTVSRLRDAVSRETKIPQDQVLLPSCSLIPSSLSSVLLGYMNTEVNLNALFSGGT